MATMTAPATTGIGSLLREWRQRRRLSQLDVSARAAISTRHLSFLETGRARPSREMVIHLAEELDVPLRERNTLLVAAGYAPVYRETPLDSRPTRRRPLPSGRYRPEGVTVGDGIEPQRVAFASDGIEIVGHLRVPAGALGPRPGLVFTGPLSGVKEQVVGTYADGLTRAGFVTLALDHRHFGESGGEPRQHENPAGKLADLRDGLSWLATRPEVDGERLGACGVCLGGGYALRFAAFDPRVRAVACVAGGYNDPAAMRTGMGPDGYRKLLADFAEVARRQFETGEVEYLAAVSDEGTPAVMGGDEPFAYYGTERSASPGWVNRLTALTVRELITTDLAVGADFVAPTPLLVVHGRTDAYCSPEGAQAVFDRVEGPKDILWLDTTNHIDLYDVERYVGPAVDRCADWFARHLG